VRTCSNCGHNITPREDFCTNCGTRQTATDSPASPELAHPVQPGSPPEGPEVPLPLEVREENAAAPQRPQGPEDRGELPPPPAPPVPAAPASAVILDARRSKPTPGQIMVMAAGVLMFIWSFLAWYSSPTGSANAWSTATIPGLVLTATWVPLLSLAIAALVAIKALGSLPDRVWGFSWAQLSVVVGLFDVLITFGFLVANRSLGSFGTLTLGAGLILSFITALVMLAGAILDHAGVGADNSSSNHQRAQDELQQGQQREP